MNENTQKEPEPKTVYLAKNNQPPWQYDSRMESIIGEWCLARVGKEKFKRGALRLQRVLAPLLEEFKTYNLQIVTVGGTNGKGETVYALSHLLQERGIEHALWVSPHVLSICERISINGIPIDYDSLFRYLQHEYERVVVKQKEELSYYELLLCVFLSYVLDWHKQQKKLQVCILEVGMGGRLDGVNLFEPTLTAITSISRDHQDVLGKSYLQILNEKLGIARSHVPLITALELQYCQKIAKEYGDKNLIPIIDLFESGILEKSDSFSTRNKVLAEILGALLESSSDALPKEGIKQKRVNDQLDRLAKFKKREQLLHESEKIPSFKGRNEVIKWNGRKFSFFGSHNLDGVRKLMQMVNCKRENAYDITLVALSKRSYTEEASFMMQLFATAPAQKLSEKIFFTTFEHMKALKVDIDGDFFKKFSQNTWNGKKFVYYIDDWKKWITSEELQKKSILVTGSYYFVGCVQSFLHQLQK